MSRNHELQTSLQLKPRNGLQACGSSCSGLIMRFVFHIHAWHVFELITGALVKSLLDIFHLCHGLILPLNTGNVELRDMISGKQASGHLSWEARTWSEMQLRPDLPVGPRGVLSYTLLPQ